MAAQPDAVTIHASCVAFDGKAVLIQGASGSGKSALSLSLMAFGCELIADDQVVIARQDDLLVASCPPAISNMIEARGIGIVNARARSAAPIHLVVDLDHTETQRLPERRVITQLGCDLPLISRIAGAHFPAVILQILKEGLRV